MSAAPTPSASPSEENSGSLKDLRELIASAEHVSNILPEAIAMHPRDPALIKALAPAVEDVLNASVRANPQGLADALFPVMGPAIRKSLAHALAATLEGLNRSLEHSLSPRSIGWRFEAMRTGKSFAEVVMLHTVLFRVEQIFLIHGETGLLLQHVAAEDIEVQDTDMVSGMLSAIRDFVRDSFGGKSSDTLEELHVGELTVCVVPGPRAVLAGVVRGSAPRDVRAKFQEALETIHLRLGPQLEAFEGDAAPFAAAIPYMESCLVSQALEKEKKTSMALRVATTVVAFLLAWWIFDMVRENHRWNGYLARLASEPGLVVISSESSWGKHSIVGLRDPLSRDPLEVLSETEVNPTKVSSRWEPYQALLPKFIVARAKGLLQPPPEVSLSFENGMLFVKGQVTQEWFNESARMVKALPGVSMLARGESLDAILERVRTVIESTRIKFAVNQSEPLDSEESKFDAMAEAMRDLAAASLRATHPVRLDVDGYADPSGTEAGNLALSQARADKIREVLMMKVGSPPLTIVAQGHGAANPDAGSDAADQRRVSLRIVQISAAKTKK